MDRASAIVGRDPQHFEPAAFPARTLFDIPRDVAFFNVAALGPVMKASTAAANEALARRGQPWRVAATDWFTLAERRRAAFGDLLETAADDIALVPAASYGFAVAAANLPVGPRRAILCLDGDFPSGMNMWRRKAADCGARLILARPEKGESLTEALLRHWEPSVAIVAAAPVCWTDGALIDLARISDRARANGAALVVDATQWIGAAAFDLKRIDPDFLICASYKWLLSPYGLGYLYVAPRHHSGRPLEENWIARMGAEDFARLADHHPTYLPGARRFDAGEQVGFELGEAAIHALGQLRAWGSKRISAHLGRLTDHIAGRLAARGFALAVDGPRARHIVAVQAGNMAERDSDLAASGVFLSKRGSNLRISPHVHVDEEDIERLVKALRP